MAIAQLVEQATNYLKFTGSYPATADIRNNGKEKLITAWQVMIVLLVEQSNHCPLVMDSKPVTTGNEKIWGGEGSLQHLGSANSPPGTKINQ